MGARRVMKRGKARAAGSNLCQTEQERMGDGRHKAADGSPRGDWPSMGASGASG